MGKVYVTVDGKKKAFDTMEEAKAFQDGLPVEFKKQSVVTESKEETLSSNAETKVFPIDLSDVKIDKEGKEQEVLPTEEATQEEVEAMAETDAELN